jgi:copper ion binding protein
MKKLIVVLFAVVFMACGNANMQKEEDKASANAEIVEATISIGGMTCNHCVASVEKGINGLEGIDDLVVSLDDSTAVVKYDVSKVELASIEKAVEKRGYKVKK